MTLCCVALGGCGDDSDDEVDIDADPRRRNIAVLTAPTEGEGCLNRPLRVDSEGRITNDLVSGITVFIIEATTSPCDCARPGRTTASRAEMEVVRDELTAKGVCGESAGVSCSGFCGCRILELAGSSGDPSSPLYACQNHATITDASLVGFCYIAQSQVDESGMEAPIGNPELVAGCDSTRAQRIRYVGADTPLPGAYAFFVMNSADVAQNP